MKLIYKIKSKDLLDHKVCPFSLRSLSQIPKFLFTLIQLIFAFEMKHELDDCHAYLSTTCKFSDSDPKEEVPAAGIQVKTVRNQVTIKLHFGTNRPFALLGWAFSLEICKMRRFAQFSSWDEASSFLCGWEKSSFGRTYWIPRRHAGQFWNRCYNSNYIDVSTYR